MCGASIPTPGNTRGAALSGRVSVALDDIGRMLSAYVEEDQ